MKSMVFTSPARAVGHRAVTLGSWVIPGVVLAVLPKCPACFAAYAALWTGIGISMPVASGLRLALLVVSITSLAFLAFRAVRRARGQRATCSQETIQITGTAETAGTAGKPAGCNHC